MACMISAVCSQCGTIELDMITGGGEFSKSNSDEGESNYKSNRTEHSVVRAWGTIELEEATLYASDSEV